MPAKLTNQDIIDLVEGGLPAERRDAVREALEANPELAGKLRELAADRRGLRALGGDDAGVRPPAGLVDRAMTAAAADRQKLRLVGAEAGEPESGRARHRRPTLVKQRWIVGVAAMLALAASAAWVWLIIGRTDPSRTPARTAFTPPVMTSVERPGPAQFDPTPGLVELETENAAQREFDRQFERVAANDDFGDVVTTPGSADDVLREVLDLAATDGVSPGAAIEASGIPPAELGAALLEGRVEVVVGTRAPLRLAQAAAALDGAKGPGGSAIAVRGAGGRPMAGLIAAWAKPAADPIEDGEAPTPTPPKRDPMVIGVSYAAPTERAIPIAVSEFSQLLRPIGDQAVRMDVRVLEDAQGVSTPAPLDARAALWWEHGPSAWVGRVGAAFTLRVEPVVEAADPSASD